jgi:ubiquinone/menaquinone biosynthesis C-methylase UbiE
MNSIEKTSDSSHVCPWWLIRAFDNPIRRILQNPYSILRDTIHPGDNCLDLGCGIGYFTIPLATLAGPRGSVTAVDLQPQMLEGVLKRAKNAKLEERVRVHQADSSGMPFNCVFDFALAFWMLHEVPDQRLMLADIGRALKPPGRFFLVEPKGHVSAIAFKRSIQVAQEIGFTVESERKVPLSRAVMFSHGVGPAA